MQISKKHSLVIALVLGEFVCLALGAIWFSRWLDDSIKQQASRQVLEDNTLIAAQMAQLIDTMQLQDLETGSQDWHRLQKVVEKIELPNQGFVCITSSSDGRLLCHPELRAKPGMAEMKPGAAALHHAGESQSIIELMQMLGVASGHAKMHDGVHLIAAQRIPSLDANVMVHQRQSGIDVSVGRILGPVRAMGWMVALSVALISGVLSFGIISRYENRLASINTELEITVRKRTQALIKTRNATIFGLAKLAESRDTDTGDHLERIRRYVTILADEMAAQNPEIDDLFVEDLELASSLHDIGKVGVPDAILLKPARLTSEERRVIEQHPVIGGDCLAEIELRLGDDDFLGMARQIAYSHHERWDGKGYPHGLRDTEIPLAARIVAVADVYDALTSRRPYKEAMEHREAFDLIVGGAGTQFDPEVVAAFKAQERRFAELAQLSQSTSSRRSISRELLPV